MPVTPLSAEWWATRLYNALRARQRDIDLYTAYYKGDAPYPWLPEQAQREFQRILKMSRSNYMGLVVDATAERMEVLGFRRGGDDADADAWRRWQASNMDRHAPQAIFEAVKTGHSYLLVTARRDDTSRITAEHPSQAIVENEPGDVTRRAAGMKMWADDRVGKTMATLYLPDGWGPNGDGEASIFWWEGPRRSSPAKWDRRLVTGSEWPGENSLGVVPLIELPNNPDLFGAGVSEIHDVTDIQDRINKTLVDRLMTQDFGAFPQKWATGWPDDEEDDDEEDRRDDENPPVDIGRNRLVIARGAGSDKTKFGQFDAAPLDPYSGAKVEDVKDIASRTRTPPQYLLGDMANLSADALVAAESGLVAKVMQRREPFADGFEEAMRLALRIDGLDRDEDLGLQTIWRNPQFRAPAQEIAALVQAVQVLGMPQEAAWERMDITPDEIARWKRLQVAQSQRVLGADLASLLTGEKPEQLPMDVEELERRANVYGQLIRAGVTPESAKRQAGLLDVEHSGLAPVTLKGEGE